MRDRMREQVKTGGLLLLGMAAIAVVLVLVDRFEPMGIGAGVVGMVLIAANLLYSTLRKPGKNEPVEEIGVSWRRAALLATIPWLLLVVGIFGITILEGLPRHNGWPDYLWAMGKMALPLYLLCVFALRFSYPDPRQIARPGELRPPLR